jgi:hypothetical protein
MPAMFYSGTPHCTVKKDVKGEASVCEEDASRIAWEAVGAKGMSVWRAKTQTAAGGKYRRRP